MVTVALALAVSLGASAQALGPTSPSNAARCAASHRTWAALESCVGHLTPGAQTNGVVGPYLSWSPSSGTDSWSSIEQHVTPLGHPPDTFWATQWFWNGAANGGYAGIQTDGVLADGSTGDLAIFSIWDATIATPSSTSGCLPFGGEGVGMSCRVPISLVPGHDYDLSVATDTVNSRTRTWHATLHDETAGIDDDIGRIVAPNTAPAATPNNFVEYFGDHVSCQQQPFVRATFGTPDLVSDDGAFSDAGAYSGSPKRKCAGMTIESVTPDVTVAFGGPRPYFPTDVNASTSGASIRVTWTPPASDGGSAIKKYVVEYAVGGTKWKKIAKAGGGQPTATIKALPTGTYVFRVAASNAHGAGAWSAPSLAVNLS